MTAWITEEGFRDADDVLENARIGRSFMERLDDVRRTPGWEHWAPADDPAEIVCDLLNALADANSAQAERTRQLEEALKSIRINARARNTAATVEVIFNIADYALSKDHPHAD